jgi:hypothetical protein
LRIDALQQIQHLRLLSLWNFGGSDESHFAVAPTTRTKRTVRSPLLHLRHRARREGDVRDDSPDRI